MKSPLIEPLDPATWFLRVERLLDFAGKLDDERHDVVIRTAYHLVVLAPGPLRELFPRSIDEDGIEALLECGGHESAILALIGRKVAFRAERESGSDIVEVVMSLEPDSIAVKGRHETLAMAMLKAWAQSLVNFGKTARALNRAGRDPRISRGGLHPSLTEH